MIKIKVSRNAYVSMCVGFSTHWYVFGTQPLSSQLRARPPPPLPWRPLPSGVLCVCGRREAPWPGQIADDIYAWALQARRTCLLLIDNGHDKEGKDGWDERHTALLELAVRLFCTALLHEKQDRIPKAVVCCEEVLRAQHEVIPDAWDNPNLFHLFVASVGCMPRSCMVCF